MEDGGKCGPDAECGMSLDQMKPLNPPIFLNY
jgi:hypothetical protein